MYNNNLEIVLSNDIGNNNDVPYYFNKTQNIVSGNLTNDNKGIIYSLNPNFSPVNDRFTLNNNNTKDKLYLNIVIGKVGDITYDGINFLIGIIGIILIFVVLLLFKIQFANIMSKKRRNKILSKNPFSRIINY